MNYKDGATIFHMKLSIIIPTLNEEKFIGGILDDLAAQTFTHFEVIHVDAKSEDSTCEIVRSCQKKLSIDTYLSPRRNLSYQRNWGAEKAKGEYLVFIDADTRIPDRDFIAKIIKATEESKYLIYFPIVRVASKDPSLRLAFALYNKGIEASQLLSAPIPTSGLAVFERHFFYHMGGYAVSQKHDTKKLFPEDQEILRKAKKMGVIGKPIKTTYFLLSLRRFEREGWLGVLPKVLITTIEQSLGKPFLESTYEMGGHLYKENEIQSPKSK